MKNEMMKTKSIVKRGLAAVWAVASILTVAGSTFAWTARAESLTKHPRVAELEDSLRADASNYLRSRFPDQPFLVSVSVDPIRRGAKIAGDEAEALPYFDVAESEITDEWDDPSASLHQLLIRTNKVVVEISLSENVSDAERAEVRDWLYRSLHLVQARDEIKVETRKWSSSRSFTYYFVGALALALLFLVGFAIVQRYGYQKMAQAFSKVQLNPAPGASSGPVAMPEKKTEKDAVGAKGGLEFSDPIKAQELMVRMVESVEKLSVFPTLNTMVQLDRYGSSHPGGLGAILQEFSGALQKKVFALGKGDHWYEAMLTPGHFGMEQLHFFQTLIREAAHPHEPHIEEMLIHVWRLDAQMESFIQKLDKGQAISILSYFPKDTAVQMARKAFPGGWADLLNPDFQPMKFDATFCKRVVADAQKVRAHMDFDKLSQYRQLSELMAFLKVATPEEEREIYLVTKPDSLVHKTRPPFYVVLEGSEEHLKEFVPSITPQQWTMALFNVSRQERRRVQDLMQEKQRFLFVERMKHLDQNHPDPQQVGEMREFLARRFLEHKQTQDRLASALDDVAKSALADAGKNDSGSNDQAA